jgi:RHS repeat-associated protein
VITAQDYYPFGMLMPGRHGYAAQGGWANGSSSSGSLPADMTLNARAGNLPAEYVASNSIDFLPGFESGSADTFTAYIDETGGSGSGGSSGEASGIYRYGFNGKENDNELKGSGNQQDYGMRIYDPRLGRFLSTDPLTRNYPHYSPYQFAGNSPITFIDLDGLERYYAGDGSLIHWYGWSMKRMVVSNSVIANTMKANPHAFENVAFRKQVSTPARLMDGSETVHEEAINAVKLGASMYLNKANRSTGDERNANIEAYSLLIDFANGNGPYLRQYKQGNPFLNLLNADNQMLKEVVKDFEAELSLKRKNAKQYFSTNNTFTSGYEFSPDHAFMKDGLKGVKESIWKHIDALSKNPIAFVIGGMSYTMEPVFDKKSNISAYKIVFSNISGKESLLLHQATNIPSVEGMNIPLSDKKQTFSFTISAKEYDNLKTQK